MHSRSLLGFFCFAMLSFQPLSERLKSHEDQSLQTWWLLQVSEGGHTYYHLVRQVSSRCPPQCYLCRSTLQCWSTSSQLALSIPRHSSICSCCSSPYKYEITSLFVSGPILTKGTPFKDSSAPVAVVPTAEDQQRKTQPSTFVWKNYEGSRLCCANNSTWSHRISCRVSPVDTNLS